MPIAVMSLMIRATIVMGISICDSPLAAHTGVLRANMSQRRTAYTSKSRMLSSSTHIHALAAMVFINVFQERAPMRFSSSTVCRCAGFSR